MTHDASHSYTYDAENRITKVDGGSTATYVYDAGGNRVQKTAGGVTMNYVHDLQSRVIAEFSSACNYCWTVGYTYLNGGLAAIYTNSTTYFVHTARYNSSTLGRFMSPDPIGNFVADATNPQTWNLYTYALNNPLRYVDPTGTDGQDYNDCIGSGNDPSQCGSPPITSQSNPPTCWGASCEESSIVDGADDGEYPLIGTEGPVTIIRWHVPPPQRSKKRPPQTPTWWLQTKVFVSTLGNNFLNEFKPDGCFAQFANELATGQAADASPSGAGPEDVMRSTGQAAAATYAIGQGLSYPLKSSIYRGILGLTETAAGIVTLAPLDYEAGKAFVHEMQSLDAGTCQ